MATYAEIFAIEKTDNTKFYGRVVIALYIAARATMIAVDATAQDRKWAGVTLYDPAGQGRIAMRALIAEFNHLPVSQIVGADDATLQQKVDAVVPILVKINNGE